MNKLYAFDQLLVNRNAKIKEALKILDSNREKILFVVNEQKELLGSITDGDIRRWILSDGDLSANIEQVAFKGTFKVEQNYDISNLKNEVMKKKINYVPVLDKNSNIVEVLSFDDSIHDSVSKNNSLGFSIPVVIMAGGKGTRLDPFTKVLPKPLIPIGEKTILEIIIEKFMEYGVQEFYLSVNHKAKIIKSYFDEVDYKNIKINYIFENKPLGTVGSVKQLENVLEKDFILTNCDIIIDANYKEICDYHTEQNNDITIVASLKHYSIPYGVCEIENGGTLSVIKEKPEYDFLVNTGMYIINPRLLNLIPSDEFFHITHLIEKANKLNCKIKIYPISENSWIDVGEWIEYKKAIDKLKL